MSQSSDLHVYVMPPVDEWHGWTDLSKHQPESIYPNEQVGWMAFHKSDNLALRAEVDRLLYEGRKAAEASLDYRGDIARGPYMSMLPGTPKSRPVVAWVSAERGFAFVASSVGLPHLEPLAAEVTAIRETPEPATPEWDLDAVPF